MKHIILLVIFLVLLAGCSLSAAPQVELQSVEINTIIVKMVERPVDRELDFTVIYLDGNYTVSFDPNSCQMDDQPYIYGPYNSLRHCVIQDDSIIQSMVNDQAWLDRRLTPFKEYLSCINGWVYLGVNDQGTEIWFVEMFGFPAFCS